MSSAELARQQQCIYRLHHESIKSGLFIRPAFRKPHKAGIGLVRHPESNCKCMHYHGSSIIMEGSRSCRQTDAVTYISSACAYLFWPGTRGPWRAGPAERGVCPQTLQGFKNPGLLEQAHSASHEAVI